MYDSLEGDGITLSSKSDIRLLQTQQQTIEFIQHSSIYGQQQTL
jgi:hypothetical protein